MSKLLVVDDEYRIRQIIKKYAEFEGYEVEEAVDGMQAIELLYFVVRAVFRKHPGPGRNLLRQYRTIPA